MAALAGGSQAAPRCGVSPERFDFGRVLQERTLEKQFQVRNLGDEDLRIEDIASDCGCTAALLDDKDRVLKPGASATLLVKFSTRRAEGPVKRTVLVRSNDPDQSTFRLTLEAVVVRPAKKAR
jgi:hypothetical protein